MKMRYQELESIKAGTGAIVADSGVSEELRREIALLKNRIEDLEMELMAQEKELQAAKTSLKDRHNDPMVSEMMVRNGYRPRI